MLFADDDRKAKLFAGRKQTSEGVEVVAAGETLIVCFFKLLVVIFLFALVPLLLLNHTRGTYLKFWIEEARAEGLGCLLARLDEAVEG